MLKKIGLALALLAATVAPARAGIYYDLQQSASSATLRMVGVAKWWASAFSGSPTVIINGVDGSVTASSGNFTANGTNYSVITSSGVSVGGTGGVFATFFKATSNFIGNLIGNVTGNLTGNVTGNLTGVASQATIWDHTPTKCSAGNYPLGTDTGGNAANCTAAGIGDMTQAGANTVTGNNTYTNVSTFSTSGYVIGISSFGVVNLAFASTNAPGFNASVSNGFGVASSTITLSPSVPKYLEVCVQGIIKQNNGTCQVFWTFLDNGAFDDSLSYSNPVYATGQTLASGLPQILTQCYTTTNPVSATTHNIALAIACGTGCNCGSPAAANIGVPQFRVTARP